MRLKKTSQALETARLRALGMKTIDPALNLGRGLNLEIYNQLIEEVSEKLDRYNTILSAADTARSDLNQAEQTLRDYSQHMLMGVGTFYGRSSDEYEQAGGTRKVERRGSMRGQESTDSV